MSRDMMPSFELLQPTKLADALSLLDSRGNDIWKMAGGNDSLDWFKDRIKRPKAVMDLGGVAELKGIRETADGVEIGALTTLTEVANSPVIKKQVQGAGGRGHPCRQPADPQLGHDRRQRLAGRALLVLPLRPQLLSGRRQHLLLRHARRTEPRARDLRCLPLRRGQPVGHRAGADRARSRAW